MSAYNFMHLQPADLPCKQQSRDLVTPLPQPTFRGECLVNNSKEKQKNTGVSVFSLFFFVLIFFLPVFVFFLFCFLFWKKKENCEQRAEHTGVIQREVVRGGRGMGFDSDLPLFTHCCCSPGLYIECPLRCSLCQGAGPHTCPHTNRCPVCVREMACTVGQKVRNWQVNGFRQV